MGEYTFVQTVSPTNLSPNGSVPSFSSFRSMADSDQEPTSGGHGKVELMIRCTELVDLDIFSKSDPLCVLFIKQFGQWKEYGRTEAILDSLNPRFPETFILDYDRALTQPMMFSVYDIDSRSLDLRKHDHVGKMECSMESLIQPDWPIKTTTHSLYVPGDPHVRGYIHITAEFVNETRSRAMMQIGGSKLNKRGILSIGKNDSFLEVCRSINSVDFHPVFKTEVVHKSQEPRWRPFEIPIQKLCNGDLDRPIQFICWHLQSANQSWELIGQAVTTVRKLNDYKGKTCNMLPLLEPKKIKKKSYKDSGHLRVFQFKLDMKYTLLDYVRGGCNIKFMLAIDFTASNGKAADPMSLHYLHGAVDNQYIEAIKTVGAMLSHYDLDQKFPVFGFGAKLSAKKKVSHCFPINGDKEDPTVKGIKGVIESYRRIVPKLTFGGPSVFSQVIKYATHLIRDKQPAQDDQFYNVLLIITDGVVNDLDNMMDAVTQSSSLPFSVVAVGIGPADFSLMEQFQTQHAELLKGTKKREAVRDNFHFAALRKQKYSTGANTYIAQECLATMSKHATCYFKDRGIQPNKPRLHRPDPLRGQWISKHTDLELDDWQPSVLSPLSSTMLAIASHSNTYTNTTGPMCPTCGALMESSKKKVMELNPR